MIPTEKKFFRLLEEQAENISLGYEAFHDLFADYTDIEKKVDAVKIFEEKGDVIKKNFMKELMEAFITPLDREDLHTICTMLDDGINYTEGISQRLILFQIEELSDIMVQQAELLYKASVEMKKAIFALDVGDPLPNCEVINELEDEGDILFRKGLAELYNSFDAMKILKQKEVIEMLENAMDHWKHLARFIENLTIKTK
jgi:uncharacterized protein Yka (UPF0111/DUF47 family)